MATKTRISKVKRLTRDLRERISQMLLDGKSSEAILASLAQQKAENPEPWRSPEAQGAADYSENPDVGNNSQLSDLTAADITAWQKTGHKDWLEERKQLAELEHIRELARRVLAAGDGTVVQEASLQIVAARLYELLSWFTPKAFKKKTHENLADYARLVNALIKLSDGGLKFERYRAQVAERKAEMEKALQAEKEAPGLSPEARAIIERELNLL